MSNRNRDYKTLRPGQLKRRFLRLRYADPEADINPDPMPLDAEYSGLSDEINPYDCEYGSLDEYLPYEIIDVLRLRTTFGDQIVSENERGELFDERGSLSLNNLRGLDVCEDHDTLVEEIVDHLSALAEDPLSGLGRVRMDIHELRSLRRFLDEVSAEPRNALSADALGWELADALRWDLFEVPHNYPQSSFRDQVAYGIFAVILYVSAFSNQKVRSLARNTRLQSPRVSSQTPVCPP